MSLRHVVFSKHLLHQVRVDVAALKRPRIQTIGGKGTLWIGFFSLAHTLLNGSSIQLREFASDDWFDVWHPSLCGYFLRGTNLTLAELVQLGERLGNSAHCLRDGAYANYATLMPYQAA